MILVLSDLHWGDGSAADHASYDAVDRLIADLPTYDGLSEIVVAGDWIEGWRSGRDASLRHNRERLARLSRQCLGLDIEVTWILGNHDWHADPADALAASRAAGLRCGLRVTTDPVWRLGWLIRHGHEWDRFNATDNGRPALAAAVTGAVGWVERRIRRGLDDRRLNPLQWISPAHAPELAGEVHLGAKTWAMTHQVRVIYGHTHHGYDPIGTFDRDGWATANIGHGTRGTLTGIWITTDQLGERGYGWVKREQFAGQPIPPPQGG